MTTTPFKQRRKRAIVVKDLLDKMRQNPRRYQLRSRDQTARSKAIYENMLAAQPVLDDLDEIGIRVGTIAELFNSKLDYREAVPVLLRWLPKTGNVDVKEDIVRALSVPWARPAAAKCLVEEFRTAGDRDGGALKWAIGNALSVVADDSVFDAVVTFALDRRHGRARQMLALALANMADRRAGDILIELLADDETAGHAIIALGRLRVERAKARIQEFKSHGKAWVRREAQRAIRRIEEGK